jgi:hypothetical protein
MIAGISRGAYFTGVFDLALVCVAADASSAVACGNSITAIARGPLCSLRVLRYCAEALVAHKSTQDATTAQMTRYIQVGYNFRRRGRLMTEGKKAPDFNLSDENGSMVRLKELRGQNVVLFFYPKADTPG